LWRLKPFSPELLIFNRLFAGTKLLATPGISAAFGEAYMGFNETYQVGKGENYE
jgi:hypothetical protein